MTTTSQSGSKCSSPWRTESCRLRPPACKAHSRQLIFESDRINSLHLDISFSATTRITLRTVRDSAKRLRVWRISGRPEIGKKGLEISPPILFPSPAATMTAFTRINMPKKTRAESLALGPYPVVKRSPYSVSEDMTQLFQNLFFRVGASNGKLLDQKIPRGIEHFALPEGKLLVSLENKKVAQHLGNFQNRAGFDFLRVFSIAPIPSLLISFHFLLA